MGKESSLWISLLDLDMKQDPCMARLQTASFGDRICHRSAFCHFGAMLNFTYDNPTRIEFGRDTISKISELVPVDARILLVYGGGSIKRNGVYDQVKAALAGHPAVLEFGGVEANPDYATCMRAVELARSEKIDYLLSVGGGSVLDGVKFIAAAIPFEGEPWTILSEHAEVLSAVPIGCVLTLPATGSEANGNSVISRRETSEKLYFGSRKVYPQFSILDPETTFTLSPIQTANGIGDAFVHCCEQYLTYPVNSPLQDRQAEAVMLTLIEEGSKVMTNPNDYEARANVMWCATCALNNTLGLGVIEDWATHMIGHELTAFFGLDHARTLTIVLPSLLRQQKEKKREKLLQFARRVWDARDVDEDVAIEAGIRKMEQYFQSLGLPVRLSQCDIEPSQAAPIVARFSEAGAAFGEHQDIDAAKVDAILRASA